MDLFPSIDLRAGQVVRLARGDYDVQTMYDDDPVAVARRFDAAGARWIHVVDLDAALEGGNPNLSAIEAICANVTAKVQTGGGVRSVNDASERFAAGATRVVVGSAAVEHPEVVDRAERAPPRSGRGRARRPGPRRRDPRLDRRDRPRPRRRSRSSSTEPGVGALDRHRHHPRRHAHRARARPARGRGRRGRRAGHREWRRRHARRPARAGGVRGRGKRLAGSIVGRAIYENRFTVEEGIAACSPSA